MKQNTVITFTLFVFSQFMLWIISIEDNIIGIDEVVGVTIFICLFLALFFAGFRWARWVVTVILGVLILFLVETSLEGFGLSFSGIALLYAAVIFMLFRHPAPVNVVDIENISPDTEVLDAPGTFARTPIVNGFSVGDNVYHYPLLLKRYQCVFIDYMLLLLVMVVTMVMLDESPYRQSVMITMGILFFLCYEPLLTTYSATIGQRLLGIRVRDMRNPSLRINIVQAYVRVAVKWFFGWLSFVTINFNPAHRAIHDMAGNSVVIQLK